MKIVIADETSALNEQRSASAQQRRTVSCALEISLPQSSMPGMGAAGADIDLSDQKELAATITDAIGQSLLNRGFLHEAKALIKEAYEIRSQFLGDDHPATANSLNSRARVARNEGRLDIAEQHSRAALAINSRVFGATSYPVAQTLNELARIQLQKSDLDAAEQSASDGLKVIEALHLESKDLIVSRLLDTLGRVYQVRGEYGQATEAYTRALALDLKLIGDSHPEYVIHYGNFATVKEAQGEWEEAAKAYQKIIDTYERLKLPHHWNRIDAEANLGAVLLTTAKTKEEFEQAGKRLKEALELNKRVRGQQHYLVGKDYVGLARYEFERPESNGAKALEYLERALKIYASHDIEARKAGTALPAIHGYVAEALTWRGRVLLETPSASADAERDLRRAVTVWDTDVGPDSVEAAIASAYLGRALFLKDQANPEAVRLLERGYCIVSEVRGADSKTARLIKPWLDQATRSAPPDPCR
jgi:tetratricopeptide (TPR) repeat protein